MDTDEDLALIGRARDGDEAAFGELVERHARRLHPVCYRLTRDMELAEDAVQEALIKAWTKLESFDGRSMFTTWLHRIAVNTTLDMLRKNRVETLPEEPDLDRLVDSAPGPDVVSEADQIGVATQAALDELSEMERTAFVLRHHEGVPMKEISQLLGVADGACRQAVFRAVRKLRVALQPFAVEHGHDH